MSKVQIAFRHETMLGVAGALPLDTGKLRNSILPALPAPLARRTGVTREEFIAYVQRKRLQAQKNMSHQRIRELHSKPTRIPSSFWERVIRDYDRTLASIDATPPGTTFTLEQHAR